MDFGDILKDWENKNSTKKTEKKRKAQQEKKVNPMDQLLNEFSPDNDVLLSKEEASPKVHSLSRTKMRRKKADSTLDLHGMTAEEAKIELNNFIRKSYRNGARKILIIHGKGNHTDGRAVLKPLVKSLLEISPYVGDSGTAERRDGGSGATWAVLRQKSR